MSGDVRQELAEAVARRVYAEGPDGEVDPTALVNELAPVVERIARQRAADELRAAASEHDVLRVRAHCIARADELEQQP